MEVRTYIEWWRSGGWKWGGYRSGSSGSRSCWGEKRAIAGTPETTPTAERTGEWRRRWGKEPAPITGWVKLTCWPGRREFLSILTLYCTFFCLLWKMPFSFSWLLVFDSQMEALYKDTDHKYKIIHNTPKMCWTKDIETNNKHKIQIAIPPFSSQKVESSTRSDKTLRRCKSW